MNSRALGSRPFHRILWCGLAALAVLLAAPAADAQTGETDEVVIFVLDLSGSMNEPFDGQRTKLDVAKAAFVEAFANVSPEALVGLRVYGDQNPAAAPGQRGANCTEDSRLVVPVSTLQRNSLIGQVQGFTARGDTSISLALERASEDIPEGSVGTIVLFSDGRDECFDADLDGDAAVGPSYGEDPCVVAEGLAAGGKVDRIMTVGFGADTAAEAELRCISSSSSGRYTPIETPADAREILPELLVELSTGRSAQRLGDRAITGTALREDAPAMPRLDDPEAGSGIYTDSIGLGETKWYFLDEFGPGPATLTATVFDLPPEADISLDMALYDALSDELRLERSAGNAGLPDRPSASIRCGECEIGDEAIGVYWRVGLSSGNPEVTGTFDLELATGGPGFGGRLAGCHEPLECWYPPELETRSQELVRLQNELADWDTGQASQDLLAKRSELRSELDVVQAEADATTAKAEEFEAILDAVPPKGKSFKLPLLMMLGGALLAFAPLDKLKREKKEAEEEDQADAAEATAGPGPAAVVAEPEAPASAIEMPVSTDTELPPVPVATVEPVEAEVSATVEPVEAEVSATVAPVEAEVSAQAPVESSSTELEVHTAASIALRASQADSAAAISGAGTATALATSPDPGWYPDPLDPTQFRWWTGSEWTEYTGGDNEDGSSS